MAAASHKSPPAAWRLFLGVVLIVLVYACVWPVAANASDDVIVNTTDVKLKAVADGAHTATITVLNAGPSTFRIKAGTGDDKCSVTPSPKRVKPGQLVTETLTLSKKCDTANGADITLHFVKNVTPRAVVIHAAAATVKPKWSILIWSFLGAFLGSMLLAYAVYRSLRDRKGAAPPDKSTRPPEDSPRLAGHVEDGGSLPAGAYLYRLSAITEGEESLLEGELADPLAVGKNEKVVLTVPLGPEGTTERRVYRRVGNEAQFHRVGYIPENKTTSYEDNWPGLQRSTALVGLGTDWSFKDNWVSSVSVGSGVLVALLATSNVLEAVLGTKPEAALGLMAVAGALGAVFVGIGPLFVKVIGKDLAVPTVLGTLVAAFVTLFGTLGQVSVMTAQGWYLADRRIGVQVAVVVVGTLVTGVVVWYAIAALRSYAKTALGFKAPPLSDTLVGAANIAAAIRKKSPLVLRRPTAEPPRNSLL